MCSRIPRSAKFTISLGSIPITLPTPLRAAPHRAQDVHRPALISVASIGVPQQLRVALVVAAQVFATSLPTSLVAALRRNQNLPALSPNEALTSRCHWRSHLKKQSKASQPT